MNDNSWMDDPALKNMDPFKLKILSQIAQEANGKSQKELLPFFMSAMRQANAQGVSFSDPERELLVNILLQHLSPAEKKKAEAIIKLASAYHKK